MTKIIEIPLEPVAKGRPRLSRGHAYTPEKTRVYEEAVGLIASRAFKSPLTSPIAVDISFYLPAPKSWSEAKKRMAVTGEIRPVSRPDIDNLGKAICDACNGIVWTDDSLIVDMHLQEFYGEPRTVLKVEEL